MRSAGGRAAVCGAPAGRVPDFGAFSSSPYTVPLCWVWGPGIAVLRSCKRIDVCDSVRLLYLLLYLLPEGGDAINNKMDLDRPTDRFLSISDLEKSTDRHPGTRDRDFYDSDPYCTRGVFQI